MSEENDPSRQAEIKIVKEGESAFYQIKVTFLGHISAAIRWDDNEEEGRSDVCALLRDAVAMAKNAFMEIEIDKAASGIDQDLAELFGDDVDILFIPEGACLCSQKVGLHPDCPFHGESE